jgi:hypothetical protein
VSLFNAPSPPLPEDVEPSYDDPSYVAGPDGGAVDARRAVLPFVAYRISSPAPDLVVAPADRSWMDATVHGVANRCLPLRMANQAGWLLLNYEPAEIFWSGGTGAAAVKIRSSGNCPDLAPVSHFGHGIVTWRIPYLFRTPLGYNLVVRGPTNWWKDGAQPLDGIVETDWAVAPFTMNWQITKLRYPVRFAAGEPLCMISPQRRYELESFSPEVREISTDQYLLAQVTHWIAKRRESIGSQDGQKPPWEKHYLRGTTTTGEVAGEHQVKLRLKPFVSIDAVGDTNKGVGLT